MKLENATDVQATLISAPMDGSDEVAAFVVAKQTYHVSPAGKLSPATEKVPISGEPIATPFGTFHGELYPRKDRADLAVLGTVRLPRPRTEAIVTVRMGQFSRPLRIVGDRVWVARRLSEPTPSPPHEFVEMPLSYVRAFGGASKGPMGDVAWPANPEGRGFYQTEEEAVGRPLPNLGWADAAPIRSWADRPEPANWGPYPMFWQLRAQDAVKLNKEQEIVGISRKAFNHAHPSMVVDALPPGERVTIQGMRSEPISFDIPESKTVVRWSCGPDQGEVWLGSDGLFIWVDQQKIVLTQRARFHYPYRPREKRSAMLLLAQ